MRPLAGLMVAALYSGAAWLMWTLAGLPGLILVLGVTIFLQGLIAATWTLKRDGAPVDVTDASNRDAPAVVAMLRWLANKRLIGRGRKTPRYGDMSE